MMSRILFCNSLQSENFVGLCRVKFFVYRGKSIQKIFDHNVYLIVILFLLEGHQELVKQVLPRVLLKHLVGSFIGSVLVDLVMLVR